MFLLLCDVLHQIKVYEASHPLSLECESLQQQIEALAHDLHAREEEVAIYRKVILSASTCNSRYIF